ncbi:EAL domain-containing protein [Telmatospirillum sp.]|uniref:sensor domain-containing protein n=1 Tax=Telmatospirillum sp. TaxID=2079197 RepID=UPI0028470BCD|nr:EAL domain-containing protein [Telmatospirillum sp.]MDR3439309.1 EAL domain-containing protein [Telmatospirillum sp.]
MVSVVALSVPDTIVGATLGSVVLVAAIFLLARAPGAPPGIRRFGLAFVANFLRYLILLFLPDQTDWHFILSESLHGLCNILLLAGSLCLVDRRYSWPTLALVWSGLFIYLLAAVNLTQSDWWRFGPPYLFACLAMGLSGVLFLRHRKKMPGLGYGPVGVVLILWGLHKLDFMLAYETAWTESLRFLASDVLATALAVAVIILAARSQEWFNKQVHADLAASRKLAETNARQLEAVLDRLTDGIVTVDEDGAVLAVNPAAERIFGLSAGSVVGKPMSVLLPDPEDPQSPGGLPAAVVRYREAVRECTVQRADGTPLILEMTVSHVSAESRSLLVVVFRDVSGPRRTAGIDALVHEVNQRVLQGLEMEGVAPVLCRRLQGLFGLLQVWVGGKAPDGSISVLGTACPLGADGHFDGPSPRWDGEAQGLAARALVLGTTQRLASVVPGVLERFVPLAREDVVAGVSVPLRVGQEVLAVVTAYATAEVTDVQVAQLEDLADRLSVPLQMMVDQQRLRLQGAAMAAAANAIFITGSNGQIEWVNDAFVRLSGYAPEDAIGQSPRLLHSGAQTAPVYRDLWRTILTGDVWRGELIERRKDGSLYTVVQTVTPMHDRLGQVSHFVVVQEDITDRKQAEERIRFLSNFDPMTSLPNRGLFRERLGQALARADVLHHPVAVLFLDLDRFSRINDTMGHDLGDRLLTQIVERLGIVTRSADMLARIGGDEFAVILDEKAGADVAVMLARRMLNVVTKPYDLDGQQVHVGASIGISLYPDDAADADQLIKNADMAMYRAIHEVPNGYRFFSNAMNEEMQERNTLERDLRRALARDEFILHYQPQRDVLTGAVIGLEALVRWNHPERGLVFPESFIFLAEETGLIVPLGEIVLRIACQQIRAWHDAGLKVVPVAVNLSAVQLHRPEFVAEISQIVVECGINPEWLELELTESGLMADAEAAEQMLRALDDFGIKLAIDDFGTGYSSLNYLKRFPVSKLKIDRSFVHSLSDESSDDAAIARAIITLGHSLGMRVVSEGVETEEQLSYLRRQGCDAVQGYLFSRPVPAAEVPPMLRASTLYPVQHSPRLEA